MRTILRRCIQVIGENLSTDFFPADEDQRSRRTPHEAFCIDGGRGSGKTFTLSSVPHILDALSNRYLGKDGEHDPKFLSWKELINQAGSPTILEACIRTYENNGKDNPRGEPPAKLAHVLRIIFPGDMEGGESVMEALFAALLKEIAPSGPSDPYADLRKSLREVAEGFYFAKRFGVDAIIRDSVDYNDLVGQFKSQSQKASLRTGAWRDLVSGYLKQRRFPVLVILLDDSDVEVDLTRDILHAIRMFLCHPRIITVLAGNTRSMRDSLVHHGMRWLSGSVPALDHGNQHTAQDWRKAIRRDAEYYLEKILPQERRFFIGPPALSFAANSELASGADDFVKVAGKSFREIIDARLKKTRDDFLQSKFRLAIKYENEHQQSDLPERQERRNIENFLSWWIFAYRYADPLSAIAPADRDIPDVLCRYENRIRGRAGRRQ